MGSACNCCQDSQNDKDQRALRKITHKHKTSVDENKSDSDQGKQENPEPEEIGPNGQNKRQGPQKYQSIKFLGKGVFGNVVLAEDKENHKMYAMKVIEKSKIKQYNLLQCEKIKNISQYDMFVSIRQTFQNQQHIYLVTQYMHRGDLFFYLKQKQNSFSEEAIRNLAAQIIIGIEILHSYGIVYRELKPQNILITDDGHIKLADYGLSKIIVEERSIITTFAGSIDYTAPQALKGNYGKQIDIWALGILLYELKFKSHPFYEDEDNEGIELIKQKMDEFNIQERIKEHIGEISQNFKNLLVRLLDKNPVTRITIPLLKEHLFFSSINWDDIPSRQNPPPISSFTGEDHIKFRDPNNRLQTAHRKYIENQSEFKAKLYEFSTPQ